MKLRLPVVLLCCTVFLPLLSLSRSQTAISADDPNYLTAEPRHAAGVEIEGQLNELDAQHLAELNPGWLRLHIKWDLVETHPGGYDWDSPEAQRVTRILQTTQELQSVPVLTVKLAPAFYRTRPDRCARPDAPGGAEGLGRFILALAERYPGLRYFEIWNEPDVPVGIEHQDFLGCFIEADGAAAAGRYYGSLMNAVGAVVKSHHPDLRLLGPGLEGSMEFLNHALAEGGRSLDLITFHHYEAYRSDTGVQYDIDSLENKHQAVRAYQAAYGLDQPVLISEGALRCAAAGAFNGITHRCTDSPNFYQQQVEWLRHLHAWAYSQELVVGFIWYTSQRNGWDDTDLVFADGEKKPVFLEFVRLTSAVARP
jgi:hypothetical protein